MTDSVGLLTKSLRGSWVECICNKFGVSDMYSPA
jgi:hypothetical protein